MLMMRCEIERGTIKMLDDSVQEKKKILGEDSLVTIEFLFLIERYMTWILTACSLIGFSQPKPASKQCFPLIKYQHQPAQTSTSTNQRALRLLMMRREIERGTRKKMLAEDSLVPIELLKVNGMNKNFGNN